MARHTSRTDAELDRAVRRAPRFGAPRADALRRPLQLLIMGACVCSCAGLSFTAPVPARSAGRGALMTAASPYAAVGLAPAPLIFDGCAPSLLDNMLPSGLESWGAPATYPAPADAVAKLAANTRYLRHHAAAIDEALDFASRAHEGQRRKSGEPYIIHPIEVACILGELKMDVDTIMAGLLHDVLEDTDVTLGELSSRFGPAVASIVAGVTDSTATAPADNQRELLLAMSAEWRVVLLKLSDRLHNMRTLEHMPRAKQLKKAKETLDLFVPLAKRVGVAPLHAELQRLSTAYVNPFPTATKTLLGQRVGGAILTRIARLQYPGTLDDFLLKDETLAHNDVEGSLAAHRQRWAEHCAAYRVGKWVA